MFAPKIAKPQTKAAADSVNDPARKRTALWPQNTIGSRATLRLMAQRPSRLTGDELEPVGDHDRESDVESAPRGISWDFSKLQLFPLDRTSRSLPPSSLGVRQLTGIVQPKLVVGEVNDPLEVEADRVADEMLWMPPDHPTLSSAGPALVSRKCAACDNEDRLHMQPANGAAVHAGATSPALVHTVLQRPGQPLDAQSRAFFEPRLKRDLAHVRIHVDAEAGRSAQSLDAAGYTVGEHIVFGAGRYDPEGTTGRRLLAHELVHVMQQVDTRQAHARALGSPTTLVQRQPDARKASKVFHLTIKITMDDQVLNPPGSGPKVTMPKELKELLTKQVAAAFAPLNDDSVSVSVEWGKFSDKELSVPGNVEVDLIPGLEGVAFEAAAKVGKRYRLSPEDQIKFGGGTHDAGGEHWSQSDIPRDKLIGPNVVLVPRIFRDRVLQWKGKKATANDKAPAELTIAYIGKSVEHEVGHAFGLSDVFNDINSPSAAKPDMNFPSQRPNVMDILPLPNEKPFEEGMDWDEFVGPEREVGTRRQKAVNAIRGPVMLPKKYADKFLHDRAQERTFNQFSRTRVEVLEDGRAVWFPAYDKFEFTKEQLTEMRTFLHGIGSSL